MNYLTNGSCRLANISIHLRATPRRVTKLSGPDVQTLLGIQRYLSNVHGLVQTSQIPQTGPNQGAGFLESPDVRGRRQLILELHYKPTFPSLFVISPLSVGAAPLGMRICTIGDARTTRSLLIWMRRMKIFSNWKVVHLLQCVPNIAPIPSKSVCS